jgi:hypothetical protein
MINWHHHNAAKHAPEESNNPLRGILPPQQNRISLSYAAGIQFARHAICLRGNSPIAPALHAISAPLSHGNLVAMRCVLFDKVSQ